MNIVLVKWMIKKEREQDFLRHWRRSINSKNKLFREFLSKVEEDKVNTWPFPTAKYSVYINVGIWESAKAFKEVIDVKGKKEPFEARRRQCVLMKSVVVDRRGQFRLPPSML